jgi:hypothetical protein
MNTHRTQRSEKPGYHIVACRGERPILRRLSSTSEICLFYAVVPKP